MQHLFRKQQSTQSDMSLIVLAELRYVMVLANSKLLARLKPKDHE
jgi:hypothetical protein